MSISINPNLLKKDYSSLFSSTGTNSSGLGIESVLSDYHSIKNGSYSKLMKAYYAKNNSKSDVEVSSASKDTTSTISKLEDTSSSLNKSASALYQSGSKSVFAENDKDKTYKAVSDYAKNYNSMLTAAASSDNDKILRSAKNMVNSTAAYSKLLSDVGITIGDDNKLSINEETFKKADTEKVKSIFNGAGSLAYQTGTSASFIHMYAAEDAKKASGLYNSYGSYSPALSTGDIYNSIF